MRPDLRRVSSHSNSRWQRRSIVVDMPLARSVGQIKAIAVDGLLDPCSQVDSSHARRSCPL